MQLLPCALLASSLLLGKVLCFQSGDGMASGDSQDSANAHSLKCYTCAETTNIAGCSTTTTCPSGSAYCRTVEATASGLRTISKSCAAACAEITTSVGGVTSSTRCCSTDLCNGGSTGTAAQTPAHAPADYNGATNVRLSYAMLTLAAGASVLLLRASL
ncbi:secreted Ly-6/uPAR domain-containing protein 2-like [Ambystoma mexicanum]|uniref:secreted Ly-6/uPAR domain-containing protein 2-like n=1 Tax=Ambystoma mexicanum TaxID=8296 RepID=UPI0037E72368